MIKMNLKDFAQLLGYKYQGQEDVFFNKIVLDSRKVEPGDLFVAVKGQATDGHKYIGQALDNGGIGVVSIGGDEEIILEKTNCLTSYKDESLEGFFYKTGKIIKSKIKARVIGITGSAGKTTTKDMLYSVLVKESIVVKTDGNLNNELGLPMTMSMADEETDWLVLEMGMRGLGEIRHLGEIAQPDYGIITSIEPVHAELLGSIENIAQAKAEIAEFIPEQGCLIINYKDKEILLPFLAKLKGQLVTVGFSYKADYYIKDIISERENETEFILKSKNGKKKIRINTPGRQNIQNASFICALGDFIGIKKDSLSALMEVKFSEMRFNISEISGIKIINDAYNANPTATCFSLESLTKISGQRKIFVFGDMFELGSYEKAGHEEVASKAMEVGVDLIFLLGEKVKHTYDKLKNMNYNMEKVFIFKEKKELLYKLRKTIQKGDVILLKGSRGMHLEEIEKSLEEFLNVL